MKWGCLIVIATPFLVVLGLVAYWPLLYPTYIVRYRLTVNAIMEGQPHSGSSVIEMRIKTQPRLVADMPPWAFKINGEAAIIDLGNGRNLIAVLGQANEWPFWAYRFPRSVERVREFSMLQGERPLDQAHWPAFVTFRDIDDPASAEAVNPKDLAKDFGDGARIESVTIAMTQEPVTHDLQRSLPWLATSVILTEWPVVSTDQISKGGLRRYDG